jgi:hypothetical protein
MRQQPSLVFLDIDGVLAHFGSNEQLDPICVGRLNRLVAATGADVVLTSSWRDVFGLDETQRRLADAGFAHQLAGAVPPLPRQTRSDEIYSFLKSKQSLPRFVILDDVPVAASLRSHLVLVDDFTGLTDRDLGASIRILHGVKTNAIDS